MASVQESEHLTAVMYVQRTEKVTAVHGLTLVQES